MVAPKPLYRDPVYDGAADPTLIWDRAGHRWVMFYTNRRANAENLPGVSWVHGTRIGMAESTDGGATWKYMGTVNVNYGKPDYTHWAPEVILNNGVYHMYLSIVPGIFNDWNAPRIDPCVIRLPDGNWRMWFKNERIDLFCRQPGPLALDCEGRSAFGFERRRAESLSLERSLLASLRCLGRLGSLLV